MTDRKPDHDPETTVRQGMSTEASGVDAAETMASTGDEENAFAQVASGTATGLGLDRGEAIGTGGLASGEDRDEVAEGDSWRQGLRREPYADPDPSSERFDLEGGRLGWERGAGLDAESQGLEYRNTSPARRRSEKDQEP